jgi:hypothetical protein
MRSFMASTIVTLMVVGFAFGQETRPSRNPPIEARDGKRMVMTWVQPYGVAKAKVRLNESFDGAGMKDGLTHLALQFWAPTKDGGVERVKKYGEISDAAIAELRDWGHAHDVRVMLCVYNGVQSWDWPLARAAFADHPSDFAAALVSEADRLGLDGVDIDLEGMGSLQADKAAFVKFVRDLSTRLHAKGKDLTVDSFAYIWNAPNQGWWKDLLPLVDGLTSMGYEETGAHAAAWRAYSAQQEAAGTEAGKLLIGMPTSKDRWQGNQALEQLRWVSEEGKVGAALWDAQLRGSAWRTRDAWTTLKQIRGPR